MKKRISMLLLTLVLVVGMVIPMTLPAMAATELEIGNAIDDGLAYLASIQNATSGAITLGYPLGDTASAILAFEDEGNFPGGVGPYSTNVEKGLDFILGYGQKAAIAVQPVGNPDTNLVNGQGIFFTSGIGEDLYETGLVMMAIVASTTPSRVYSVPGKPLTGMTYSDIIKDTVDFIAWAQIDTGNGRGGWKYWTGSGANADNSVSQWPVLGMVAAQQWGINAAPFVKSELSNFWINYIQNDSNGGSGYDSPDYLVNVAKTGGLLVEMYYVGDVKTTPRAVAAINYINANWMVGMDIWNGHRTPYGHPYAMFAVFKGLELMGVAVIPNAPATPDTPVGDWWGDYCEVLVNTQTAGGQWIWPSSYWNPVLTTAWNIIILQSTVFPVQVSVGVPTCVCEPDGYTVNVTYSSERFVTSGTVKLYMDNVLVHTENFSNFQGTASFAEVVPAPTTTGTYVWKAEMDATPVGGSLIHTENQSSINICEKPVVSGIPDQYAPFQPFDLDDYLTYGGGLTVAWSAEAPAGWTVAIDVNNIATVTAPIDATEPVDITFTASVTCPGCQLTCSGSDTAKFTPFVGFITGGGNIKVGKTVNWTFAGTVGRLADGYGTLAGQYQITDHMAKESWHCHNDFDSLIFDFTSPPATSPDALHNKATFVGHFTSNKGNEMELRITITDGAESGMKGDNILVEKWDGDSWKIWFGSNSVFISSGNLQIHEGLKY